VVLLANDARLHATAMSGRLALADHDVRLCNVHQDIVQALHRQKMNTAHVFNDDRVFGPDVDVVAMDERDHAMAKARGLHPGTGHDG
tara:strand:+ start:4916 stop:5176 length:261 start_codon:yes stop_codon:yes gene_type:complete